MEGSVVRSASLYDVVIADVVFRGSSDNSCNTRLQPVVLVVPRERLLKAQDLLLAPMWSILGNPGGYIKKL